MNEKNYFEVLNSINVNDKTEKKNNLTYLSWAWAWGEVKKLHPDAIYKIYERDDGCIYWNDGKTAWVKTGVTINGIEHIEYLPVMDYRNASILIENIKSVDVNKSIQRSLTKAVARHGLGLYIYAGEDLPEDEQSEIEKNKKANKLPSVVDGGTPLNAGELADLVSVVTDAVKFCEHYKIASIDHASKEIYVDYMKKKAK